MQRRSRGEVAGVKPGAFFKDLANPAMLATLFDHLPRTYFFIKDRGHRFVKVNRGLWLLHGCQNEGEMIGRTDFDFHPPALAAQYVEEDDTVMDQRRALVNQVWLVPGADGLLRWYISTKIPLENHRGEIAGVAGVMRPYDSAGTAPSEYRRLLPALDYVLKQFGQPITIHEMAGRARLSVSQLQREFRRLFAMTPKQYLIRVRLLTARRQLEQTVDAMGKVALDTGFCDQSHFTRAFTRAMGICPGEYRKRFALGAAVPVPAADLTSDGSFGRQIAARPRSRYVV